MSTISNTGNPHGTITESEVKLKGQGRPAEFADSGALKLVVQDAARAEMWLEQRQWGLYWRETDILYQSPRTVATFENAQVSRANVSRFTVAKHTNTLVPTMMNGIFYDSPPFVLRPRPGTKQSTVRSKTSLFGALLDDMEFKTECESGIESQVLNGTGIWKGGCYTERKIEKKYVRKNQPRTIDVPFGDKPIPIHTEESDEFEVKEVEVTKWCPFFEYCPIGTIFVAPGWRHSNKIHKAKYLIDRRYLTFEELNNLRGREGYDIPAEEELKKLFFPPVEIAISPSSYEQQQQANVIVHHADGRDQKESEDPLLQPLKVDERWDKDRVMVVVQDKLLIRNEEHGLGRIPYFSANWWNIQNAGYGIGVGRLVGTDQRVEQGSMNAALDILSMAVNQTYVRSKGANVPTQQIRQRLGGIIDVDGKVDDAFKILEPPKVPGEIWTAIQMAKQSGESASGADEAFTQGNMPNKGGSSIGRTATGAGGIIAASAGRIQGPVGRFVENVFIPFLSFLDEMVKERMPLSQIRAILSDELGDEFVRDEFDSENFLNARLKYEVLAGAHLAAKKAMAQSLPLIIQIFENPHLLDSLNSMGWTVDVKELFDMMMEMSEWKNSRQVIRLMSDDEKKTYMALKDPANQMKGKLTEIQAKHQATSQEIDQKGEARLAEKLLTDAGDRATGYTERVALERAMEPRMYDKAEEGAFHTTG